MSKRLHNQPKEQLKEVLFEERRQFIRDNAPSMELKVLARRFFEHFELKTKSTAFAALLRSLEDTGFEAQANEVKTSEFKDWMRGPVKEVKKDEKLSVPNVVKRQRTKLEVQAVVTGAHFIQQGMNRLVPEAESSVQAAARTEQLCYSAGEISDGEKNSRSASPSVAYLDRKASRTGPSNDEETKDLSSTLAGLTDDMKDTVEEPPSDIPDPTANLEHFATLGQEIEWNVMDTDILQVFREFRDENLGPFSVARDWIANLMYDSTFCQALEPALLSPVRRADPAPDIYERWPTLRAILDRVFVCDGYDDVANAIRSESMQDPIAAYLFVVIMAYFQYFQSSEKIPENINEREGFAGLTWAFMQTPLTMYGIQARYLDILITAVEARKNQDKDPLLETKETGQYADAVALYNDQQLFLAEAAQIHSPTLEKRHQDEYKLARAMRDTWISHIRSISRMRVPPRGLAIFGSVSFKDETKLLRMDFRGAFRLQQFDMFSIPLRKQGFGMKMRAAVVSCLELAARLDQETQRRNHVAPVLGFYEREPLADAVCRITKTSSTPTKVAKTPKKK
ncbi:hypothetical protein MVEG_10302 [Podila verticillata NRRL 6337]|nr:hypothetical protein MVEG_10302 [Podila verticillata NRRL 6337]